MTLFLAQLGTYGCLLRECWLPAWWWCFLRCSALADGWPLAPPPHPSPPPFFGWLGFSSLALKWLRARTGWGDPGVAWSRVMAKFYLQPPHFTLTFPQIILLPPKCYIMFICSLHISLSLSTHHLAAIILHLPDHGMPPQDLRRGPLVLSFFPPYPPLSSLLPWGTGGCLSGWAEALPGATLHGDHFIFDQSLTSPFLCSN